jgi:hypothetical protein
MTHQERIKRSIESLKESVKFLTDELWRAETDEERAGIREHLAWCATELVSLAEDLKKSLPRA